MNNVILNVDFVSGLVLEKYFGEFGLGIVDVREIRMECRDCLEDKLRFYFRKYSRIYVILNMFLDFFLESVVWRKFKFFGKFGGE